MLRIQLNGVTIRSFGYWLRDDPAKRLLPSRAIAAVGFMSWYGGITGSALIPSVTSVMNIQELNLS
jgi:hypothetical protein